MDSKALAEYVDQHRWLLNNGLFNDGIKNQLFLYGSVAHKEVKAVEVDISVENKRVSYKLYFNKNMLDKIELFKKLSKESGLIGMWRFKRMLKKEGNLHLDHLLNQFIKDYCGPKWNAEVQTLDVTGYVEGYDGETETNTPDDRKSD